MTAFPKADVQNVRVGTELDGCFWPKADIHEQCLTATLAPKLDVQMLYFAAEAKVSNRPKVVEMKALV